MEDEKPKDKESWIHIILDDSFLYLQLVPFLDF